MICTQVPNSGRMRAPITVKGAQLKQESRGFGLR